MRHSSGSFLAAVLLVAAAAIPVYAQGRNPVRPARPAGMGAGPADGYGPRDPADVEMGKKDFVASCAFCHGSSGTGGEGGPDLIRSPLVLKDRQGDQIGSIILNGRQGMPKFALSQKQIAAISAFLHEKMSEKSNRGAYKIQDVVTGNAAAGRAWFNGAGKCGTCHSPTGDLKGIAGKYDPTALQSRFLYPRQRAGRGAPAAPGGKPITVTVTEPSGKSATGVLEYVDDFSVALRDSSGEYASWRRDRIPGLKVEVHDPLSAHWELLDQYTNADMHNVLAYLETLK